MALTVKGKFFQRGEVPVFLKGVTYGPFPEGSGMEVKREFGEIAEAGFDLIRTYALPEEQELAAAEQSGLMMMPTLQWAHGMDFFREREIFEKAARDLVGWMKRLGGHPALGGMLVGNEISAEMARWMGPERVRKALDELIVKVKSLRADLPVGYASFPTTAWLEPDRADFTGMNLYLEKEASLRAYAQKLHHVAGDRPVLVTEFGLDTLRNSEDTQAELMSTALRVLHEEGMAGLTFYSWSDHWLNNGQVVQDWSFGMKRRDGSRKPVLARLRTELPSTNQTPEPERWPFISVIVCTYNGAERLWKCLQALAALNYENYEVLVVDDGSIDRTGEVLERFEKVKVLCLEHGGLSRARNAGAAAARGEIFAFTDDDCQPDQNWLRWLAWRFVDEGIAAAGGPNLAPRAEGAGEAVSAAAPGAPTHVMLDDLEAEHLPGCHLAVRREAFEAIGGFDDRFWTAGDDVDFCWRLREAGYRLGFSGASFVWHERRSTPWRYLKQQMGYGRAEALLFQKHPARFQKEKGRGRGGIRWEGVVYGGAALGVRGGDVIYAGPAGEAGFQHLVPRVMPRRTVELRFDGALTRAAVRGLDFLQSWLRPWVRWREGGPWRACHVSRISAPGKEREVVLQAENAGRAQVYQKLAERGWTPLENESFDLEKGGIRLLAATEATGRPWKRTYLRFSPERSAEVMSVVTGLGFEILDDENK